MLCFAFSGCCTYTNRLVEVSHFKTDFTVFVHEVEICERHSWVGALKAGDTTPSRSTHTYSPAAVVVGQMARGSRISGVFEKAYRDAGHVGNILILLSFSEYEFEHHILIVSSCLEVFAPI